MQNRRELYTSKPPLPEYLTTKDLNQPTKNSDLIPPTSREAVLEMMKNNVMDPSHPLAEEWDVHFSARHNGDKGQGGSGMKPSVFEEPE